MVGRRSFFLACLLALGLSACGGGGSDGASNGEGAVTPTPTAPGTPLGRYFDARWGQELYVLGNGEFWSVSTFGPDRTQFPPANGIKYGYGSWTSSGTTFSAQGEAYVVMVPVQRSTFQLSGTFSPATSLTLRWALGDSNTEFKGVFEPEFLAPAKLSDVAGSYQPFNGYMPAPTIDAEGHVLVEGGELNPCTIRGTLRPRATDALFDAEMNYVQSTTSSTSRCTLTSLTGIAAVRPGGVVMIMLKGRAFPIVLNPLARARGHYVQPAASGGPRHLYVLDDGDFYLLDLLGADGRLREGPGPRFLKGHAEPKAADFRGTGKQFILGDDYFSQDAQVSGSYQPQASADLAVAYGGGSSRFTGSYQAGFLAAAKRADVTGSYTRGAQAASIDALGNLSIDPAQDGCRITGSVFPKGSNQLYTARVKFEPPCANQDIEGVAIPQGNSLVFLLDTGFAIQLLKN